MSRDCMTRDELDVAVVRDRVASVVAVKGRRANWALAWAVAAALREQGLVPGRITFTIRGEALRVRVEALREPTPEDPTATTAIIKCVV